MPRVLACLMLVLGVLAHAPAGRAGDGLFDALDPDLLGVAETRLVQTALAAAGDYPEPPDGAWGPLSGQGLSDYAAREFDDAPRNLYVAALVIGLADLVETGGWSQRRVAGLGVSLALPAELDPPYVDGGETVWHSLDGTLAVRAVGLAEAEAVAWHATAAAAADPGFRTETRDGLMLSDGRLADGARFHLRSDRVGGVWTTVRVDAGPERAGDIDLIRASIQPGAAAAWDIPAGGHLERIVAATLDLLGEPLAPAPAPAERPAPPSPETAALPPVGPDVEATGSGFYISDRLLVTAGHVVQGCHRVALADGTRLEVVASDPELDVAALAAPARSRVWLSLGRQDATRLGERVHAAGFPYYAIAGTALHLTSGNVSALSGVDDDRRFFTFTAPIQPGNSGGPLIDGHGDVLGVVVSRLSESYIAETTGSMPQNVNYALNTAEVAGFLVRSGLGPSGAGLGDFDMDRGAPSGFEAAVVPILCR